jgi:hypothetical protein
VSDERLFVHALRAVSFGRILSVLLLAGLAAGCAGAGTERLLAAPGSLPSRSEAAGVPFFAQDRYYCGPAALAMALTWSGLSVTQYDLVPQVYTPGREGTFAADIVAAARRNGRVAIPIDTLEALLAEIAAGHPVIVFENLSLSVLPRWHFAVAIGYDLPRRTLILHSGTQARHEMALDAFERTWQRAGNWALVVLPPGSAPASRDPLPWLQAAAALERVERPADALTAYRTIRSAHPANAAARMGEANSLYALKDFRAAEESYRDVLAADATMAEAWNNLAYALMRQGKRTDAIAAAQRAVSLGGEDRRYADSLRELSAARP